MVDWGEESGELEAAAGGVKEADAGIATPLAVVSELEVDTLRVLLCVSAQHAISRCPLFVRVVRLSSSRECPFEKDGDAPWPVESSDTASDAAVVSRDLSSDVSARGSSGYRSSRADGDGRGRSQRGSG